MLPGLFGNTIANVEGSAGSWTWTAAPRCPMRNRRFGHLAPPRYVSYRRAREREQQESATLGHGSRSSTRRWILFTRASRRLSSNRLFLKRISMLKSFIPSPAYLAIPNRACRATHNNAEPSGKKKPRGAVPPKGRRLQHRSAPRGKSVIGISFGFRCCKKYPLRQKSPCQH